MPSLRLHAVAVCFALLPLAAQDANRVPPFVLTAGPTTFDELVPRAAAYLGWNVVVTDQDLGKAGTVTLQQPIRVDAAGCADLLTTLLWSRGLALTPLDVGKHLYEVVAAEGPKAPTIMGRSLHLTPEEVLAKPNLRMFVTTIVRVQHLNALGVNNALRQFYASSGNNRPGAGVILGSTGSNSSMILAGMQNEVANALRLLAKADQHAEKEPQPELAERLQRLEAKVARLEAAAKKDEPQDSAATRK
jgi:hypothetical protein